MNHQKAFLAALLPAVSICATAQVTTSAVSGKVTAETGEAVVGATIVALHQPSGTRYSGTTNKDGRFTIQGMRTGGPYKITVHYLGYEKKEFPNLFLELGVTLPLDVELKENDTALGEAVVTVTGGRRGATENFSLENITLTPTIDRHVYDVVKNMPMVQTNKAGGITIAGQNNRYNSFLVDGTVNNDVFGLAAAGTNGGQAGSNPISMDAIQEIQVSVAPFDVRQSGFTGGAINAVTKQGTNDLHGSAYVYYNNEDFYGKYRMEDHTKQPLSDQSSATYGATLGGAIVKDKLFFFASAELRKESYPSVYYPGYSTRALSVTDADAMLQRYASLTGITDTYGQRDVEQKAFNLLARLDWNIDDNNKLAFRYQHNNGWDDKYSASASSYTFNNSSYRFNNQTNSFVAELNSRLGEKAYNELRASATFVRDHRDVPYQGPTLYIKNVPVEAVNENGKNYTITVNLGTEYSSGLNYLNQDIYNLEDNLSLYLGNHTVTLGTHNEFYKMKNAFLQYSNGEWVYNSLDDFYNDEPAQFYYYYTNPERTGGDLKWAPDMYFAQFGVYAQDKWNVTTDFELTYGLRLDMPVALNSPTKNPTFNIFAAQNGFPEVGRMPSAKILASPRVGFRWFADKDRKTLVRGGLGIFTGRVPFVWLSNAYNNTGVEQIKANIQSDVPKFADYATNPYAAVQNATSVPLDIAVVDKDFKYPQVFRTNLALEQRLPGDIKLTLEGLYSKNMNAVFFENLAIKDNGVKVYAVSGNEASAAPYFNTVSSGYASIINLKNTNKGYSYSLSALLEKSFSFGLDVKAGYTFGHSKSVNDGTSSVASSNWKYNYSYNTNDPNELSYSRFDIPHRVMVQVNYNSPKYLRGRLSTTVGLVYNGFNGGRYSLTMNESADFNGDGQRGNSLLYIPTSDEVAQMSFVASGTALTGDALTAARENVEAWIAGNSYASKHRGQYAERNSCLSPWENELSLHLAETVYLPKKWGKIEVSFDIINFANLLNKKWGATYGNVYNLSPLGVYKMNKQADGSYLPAYFDNTANATLSPSDISSRWHMQLGVRYSF